MRRKESEPSGKNKGFTLVELLCTIAILGILMGIAITGVSKLIDRSKEESADQQKKNVMLAAESYFQANKDKLPKAIGATKNVSLNDLKDTNYIKEIVKNTKGESCMAESYVRVYKYSRTKYLYTPYIYCGNERKPAEETVPEPTVELKFTDKDGNTGAAALTNVSTAMLKIEISGGVNTDNTALTLEGYNISILAKRPGESELQEVYNSGTLSANQEEKLVITKKLTDYIDITDATEINVKLTARNIAGGEKSVTIKSDATSATYHDTTPPICTQIINEANENDWYVQKNNSRVISVQCSDTEGGSGCLRGTFTKTWPNETEKQAEMSTITIKDNAGNTVDCPVRVNLDWDSPRVSIKVFKSDANGNPTGNNILSGKDPGNNGWSADGKEFVATKRGEKIYTIKASDFTNNTNNWFNKNDYPYGIVLEVEATDNIHLNRYQWDTNPANTKHTDNPQGGSESTKGDYIDKKTGKVVVRLIDDGFRSGKLNVYDKAGNLTSILVEADIDKVAPPKPDLTNSGNFKVMKLAKGSNTNEISSYTFDTWSMYYLKGTLSDALQIDNLNNNNLTLSGFKDFTYLVKNQENVQYTTIGKNLLMTNVSGGVQASDSNTGSKKMSIEGKNNVAALACDKAGNCTDYSGTVILKIDTKPPKCEVSGGADVWRNSTYAYYPIYVKGRCIEEDSAHGSQCDTSRNNPVTVGFPYDYDTNINDAGALGPGKGGTIYDIAGNATNCASNQTIKIDKTAPTCEKKDYTGESCTNQPRLVSYKCKDNLSGCENVSDDLSNLGGGGFEKKYETTAGTISNVSFTARDKAGNSKYCESETITVNVDTDGPDIDIGGAITPGAPPSFNVSDPDCGGPNPSSYSCFYSNRGSWGACNATDNTCGLSVDVWVRAKDNVGNLSEVKLGHYDTEGCCSEANPYGCHVITSCRRGQTYIYENYNRLPTLVGSNVVYYRNGGINDKMYVLATGSAANGATVYKVWIDTVRGGTPFRRVGWIYRNCTSAFDQSCPNNQCPDW